VFLDIGLPGMDGYEIARRLRSFPETAEARLIALTGYGQQSDHERSREAGFDHHVVKPVDPAALHELVAVPASADVSTAH
jgi:CheY-like chemotaxis protein